MCSDVEVCILGFIAQAKAEMVGRNAAIVFRKLLNHLSPSKAPVGDAMDEQDGFTRAFIYIMDIVSLDLGVAVFERIFFFVKPVGSLHARVFSNEIKNV